MLPPALSSFVERRRVPLLFAALALHAGLWAAWMEGNGFFGRPTAEDAAVHRLHALRIMLEARQEGVAGFLRAVVEHPGPQPPVLVAVAALVGLLRGGLDPASVWAVSGLFGVLLGAGAYRLARNFGGGAFALSVAFLTLCAPVVVAMQRPFYPQLPSVAATVWAWDALLRTRRFSSLGRSIVFGLVGGLAVETKVLAASAVGAPAVALALAALARKEGRLATLGRIVAALVAAAAAILPWYWFHYDEVLKYATRVTGEDGQKLYSGGLELWSIGRWTYFANALANNGFTLPWAALVAAGVVRETRRLLRRDASDPVGDGWALAVVPLVDYPLMTVGQVSAYSVYVMGFVPLGALVACRFAASRATRAGRTAAGAWLALAAVWCLYLTNRPFDRDVLPRGVVGPFEVVPRVDYNFAQFAALAGATPDSRESWPVAEFLDRVLAESPWPAPRATCVPADSGGHVYLYRSNFEYGALERGRTLEWTPLTKFWRAQDLLGAAEAIAECEFAVVDDAKVPSAVVAGGAARFGAKTRVLDRRTPTPTSTATLLAVERETERPPVVPATVLDLPGVVRARTDFVGGWTMVGYELRADARGRPVLNAFWQPGGPGGFELEIQAFDGPTRVARVFREAGPAPGFRPPAAPWFLCQPLRVPEAFPPARIEYRIGARRAGVRGSEAFAPVERTELPKVGSRLVRVGGATAAAADSRPQKAATRPR